MVWTIQEIPTSASIKFLIASTVAKAVLDFEIDFENGHFWGIEI